MITIVHDADAAGDHAEHDAARRPAPSTNADASAPRAVSGARGGISTPSRIAAIGGTRVARSAGGSPASTRDDDADEQRDDDRARLQHGAAVGQVGAERLEQLRRAPARAPIPASRPSTAPTHARAAALRTTTERRICAREAPSVRSRPNSRVRWATVIENVLKMMNAPTNSAT